MKKYLFPFILTGLALLFIFMAFFEPEYGDLVRQSIIIFTILAVPYCFFVKDPRKGLILFLLEASLLEGPWKNFCYGMELKFLVYVIRDLLLYMTFLNFLLRKRTIVDEEHLSQKPPYTAFIVLFCINLFLQLFNPYNYNLVNSIAGSRIFWEMIPLYWMGFYFMREKKYLKGLFWTCLIIVFFNAIAALLQYTWGMERVAEISEGYRIVLYEWGRAYKGSIIRPPGLGPDMGFAGFVFCQFAPMNIALFFISLYSAIKSNKKIKFIALVILTGMGLIGLVVSLARSAVVFAVIFTLVYLWLFRKLINKKIIQSIVLIGIIIFLIMPFLSRTFSGADERFETIKNPKELLTTMFDTEGGRFEQAFIVPFQYATTFFIGNGLGKVGPGAGMFAGKAALDTNAENALNLAITEIGTLGTLIWMIFNIVIVRRGYRTFKNLNNVEMQWHIGVPMCYMITMLTFWQFGQLITFPQNAFFWFFAGTLMGAKYINET